MEIRDISQRLTEQVERVAKHLLPGGRKVGREWEAGSINGDAGRSLKLCLSGDKVGIWADFASGDSGDLIDLWSITKGLSLSEALKEIRAFLGVIEPFERIGSKKEYRKPQAPKGSKKAVENNTVMQYLTDIRKLTDKSIAAYRIGSTEAVGPFDGWKKAEPMKGTFIVFPSFRDGVLLAVKYLHTERREGKKFTLVEPGCEPVCFGWQAIDTNSREVTISEGEIDAITLFQYGFPAVSVPFGGGKGDKQQWVDSDWEHLSRFETINLCLDNDKAGHEAVDELINRLGVHRCRIVTLPRKDANQCLQDGITREEIARCFLDAKYIEPGELKNASYFTSEVIDEFYPAGGQLPGFDMPWKRVPFRFLRGEVSIITGSNGHGKSLMWNQIFLAAVMQGERVCIASLEMAPKKTLSRMVRQATATRIPAKVDVSDCLKQLSEAVWLFNLVGTGKVDRLLQVFEYAYRRHGVRQFLVDSLMKCGIAEEDYKGQKDIIDAMCDFANTTGAHVHIVCHPRKEDEAAPTGKMAVKGTGAITDLAFNVFSVWRNKAKEFALKSTDTQVMKKNGQTYSREQWEAEPDAILVCDKSRNVEGAEGKYGLFFDQESMQYKARKQDAPSQFYKIDCDLPSFDFDGEGLPL
jgi:twinkle protein